MDRIVLRYWPKGLGALLSVALLSALLSFDLHDPTFTNLRQPSGGVVNLLGLPGALIGGSLLEVLGTAALALPVLLLNWTLVQASRPRLWRYLGWCGALLVAASGLHALFWALQGLVPRPAPGLLDPGLAGRALVHWSGVTTGPWAAAFLLVYVAGFAAFRVIYAPAVGTALRDARVFAAWFLREGWRQWRVGAVRLRRGTGYAHRVAGAVALGLTRRARMGVGDLLRLLLRPLAMLAAALAEWRAPSLGRIKSRAGEENRPGLPARADAGVAQAAAAAVGGDGFDAWYGAPPRDPAEEARAVRAPAPWQRPLRPLDLDDEPAQDRPVHRARVPIAAPLPPKPAADGQTPPDEDRLQEEHPSLGVPEMAAGDGAAMDEPGGYRFQQPEAEAAWRQRFQRYARNLDLDWEEQLWRRAEEAAGADDDAAEPADTGNADP